MVLPGKIVAIIGIPISSVINDIFDVFCFNNWSVYPVLSIPNLFCINVVSVKNITLYFCNFIKNLYIVLQFILLLEYSITLQKDKPVYNKNII